MTQEIYSPASSLSQACEAVLEASDLQCSVVAQADGRVAIITNEGDHVFAVTPGISPIDLRTLINHGRMSRLQGEHDGRHALAASFRALIGAAAAA